MRLLVYPHDLSIGGSQINAIDLAAAAAAAGHEVIIYGIPGPLVAYIEERGLRFVPARRMKYRPAPSRIAQIASIVRQERIDLIHAYEWPACLDAYFGAGLVMGVPLICTVLSMAPMPQVPTSLPLIMGTEELREAAQSIHRGNVWALEPPIDTERDNPGIDGSGFRHTHDPAGDHILIVSVSRLALDLKLDALVRAIDAAETLADRYPVRLVLVGDGPARNALDARARAVNDRVGREVVRLAGAALDPRPAYAAADVVVGMGSSALRAMSIGRPVIVQGEKAFSEICEPATEHIFLRQGFYGLAEDDVGVARLAAQMERLVSDPRLCKDLGKYGRRLVCARFSLERAIPLQLEMYRKVLANPPRRSLADAARSAWLALSVELSNHDPRVKHRKLLHEMKLTAAAGGGLWPPAMVPADHGR